MTRPEFFCLVSFKEDLNTTLNDDGASLPVLNCPVGVLGGLVGELII